MSKAQIIEVDRRVAAEGLAQPDNIAATGQNRPFIRKKAIWICCEINIDDQIGLGLAVCRDTSDQEARTI